MKKILVLLLAIIGVVAIAGCDNSDLSTLNIDQLTTTTASPSDVEPNRGTTVAPMTIAPTTVVPTTVVPTEEEPKESDPSKVVPDLIKNIAANPVEYIHAEYDFTIDADQISTPEVGSKTLVEFGASGTITVELNLKDFTFLVDIKMTPAIPTEFVELGDLSALSGKEFHIYAYLASDENLYIYFNENANILVNFVMYTAMEMEPDLNTLISEAEEGGFYANIESYITDVKDSVTTIYDMVGPGLVGAGITAGYINPITYELDYDKLLEMIVDVIYEQYASIGAEGTVEETPEPKASNALLSEEETSTAEEDTEAVKQAIIDQLSVYLDWLKENLIIGAAVQGDSTIVSIELEKTDLVKEEEFSPYIDVDKAEAGFTAKIKYNKDFSSVSAEIEGIFEVVNNYEVDSTNEENEVKSEETAIEFDGSLTVTNVCTFKLPEDLSIFSEISEDKLQLMITAIKGMLPTSLVPTPEESAPATE